MKRKRCLSEVFTEKKWSIDCLIQKKKLEEYRQRSQFSITDPINVKVYIWHYKQLPAPTGKDPNDSRRKEIKLS